MVVPWNSDSKLLDGEGDAIVWCSLPLWPYRTDEWLVITEG